MDKGAQRATVPGVTRVRYDLATKEQHCINSLGTRSEKKMKAATSTFFPNFQYFCNNEKWLWQSDFEKLATIIYRVITHGLFKMNKEDREIHFLKGNNFKLKH